MYNCLSSERSNAQTCMRIIFTIMTKLPMTLYNGFTQTCMGSCCFFFLSFAYRLSFSFFLSFLLFLPPFQISYTIRWKYSVSIRDIGYQNLCFTEIKITQQINNNKLKKIFIKP